MQDFDWKEQQEVFDWFVEHGAANANRQDEDPVEVGAD